MLFNVPFHSYPSKNHTDKNPDVSPCTFVAPDTIHIFTKFQSGIPFQSKITPYLSNSADYPLSGLENTPEC